MTCLLLGHYVSDGVHPDADMYDTNDHWLTYNDSEVTPTSVASVCSQCQQTAYILFYQRGVRGQHCLLLESSDSEAGKPDSEPTNIFLFILKDCKVCTDCLFLTVLRCKTDPAQPCLLRPKSALKQQCVIT